jgi:threonylcarbamoyladenosine tRNA methylthiotransferase MtaB
VKYSVITFGCRVNQADSLAIEEQLASAGAESVSPAEADVVVVNTCSVTATADQGARQVIRRVARDNPSSRIVVTGCYATRRPEEIAALPNVVRVIGNEEKSQLLPLTRSVLPTAERYGGRLGDGPCGAPLEPGIAGRTAYTLRVQTGCAEPCAYCIIPTTRGSGRSVPIGEVIREVRRVAASGFKEIVLTGVHLGSYGRDLTPSVGLIDLLRVLASIDADLVFRISSLEPMDCTPEVLDLIALSGSRFAPHFHLPLQHASDRMLSAMRRPYTLEHYRKLVDSIRERLPHASIGSDMIVGFPGENDSDFQKNLDYLPHSPLSHLHVFPYSDRPGTAASAMRDKVNGITIRERGLELRRIGAALTGQFHASQRGSTRPGLTLEDGTLVVTDNYLKVRIPAGLPRNQRVRVRLTSLGSVLVGELVA